MLYKVEPLLKLSINIRLALNLYKESKVVSPKASSFDFRLMSSKKKGAVALTLQPPHSRWDSNPRYLTDMSD